MINTIILHFLYLCKQIDFPHKSFYDCSIGLLQSLNNLLYHKEHIFKQKGSAYYVQNFHQCGTIDRQHTFVSY